MPFIKGISNKYQFQINTNFKSRIRHWKLEIGNWKFSGGFSFIELLITIAIIGILSSVAVYTFSSAQQKSRDARRRADLDTIKKALELAKQDTQGAFYYPGCNTYTSGQCQLTATSQTSPPLATTYLGSYPVDPRTNQGYFYIPIQANCLSLPTPTCTSYKLVACLERNEQPFDSSIDSNCSTASYSVKPN